MENKMRNETAQPFGAVQQNRDVNSKRVFGNPYLLSQFLRDYSGVEEFKDLQPKQIEMIPLRYHFF